MIARLDSLRKHPSVFRHLTGLTIPAFEALAADVVPAIDAAHREALDRPNRQRAIGAGGGFGLSTADQVLMAVVWLRQYPTQEVLGFLFGVSDSTALRAVRRCLPALERAGKDTMRMPDPGAGRRRDPPALLKGTPGLAVVIDTFEQRTHRPKRRQRAYYSGKKKAHTLKSSSSPTSRLASGRRYRGHDLKLGPPSPQSHPTGHAVTGAVLVPTKATQRQEELGHRPRRLL